MSAPDKYAESAREICAPSFFGGFRADDEQHIRDVADALRAAEAEGMRRARDEVNMYPEAYYRLNSFILFAEWAETCEAQHKAEPWQGVKFKPLVWHGPDIHEEYYARSIIGNFNISCARHDGYRWCMGEWHPTLDAAKAAAQADYESRLRSTILSQAGGE